MKILDWLKKLLPQTKNTMSPATIVTLLALVEQLAQDAPEIYAEIKAIFAKENPTPADWEALRIKVLDLSYEDYVPKSDLPGASAAPGVNGSAADPNANKGAAAGNVTDQAAPAAAGTQAAPVTASGFIATTVNADGFHVPTDA